MLEVYKSDVFGLQFEHSKKIPTTKNQLCDHTLPDYDIFVHAIFRGPMVHMLWSALSIPCRCMVACVPQLPGGLRQH